MIMCRPQHLTWRWVIEISEAINNVCPEQPKVVKDNRNIDNAWTEFMKSLQSTKCYKDPIIQDILNFNRDYNNFR